MKIAGKKIAVRVAAGALLLAASSVVACTSTDPDPMPAPPNNTGGTPNMSVGGSAGAANTSGSSGASAGGTSGGGMTGGACTAATDCPMGQQCVMMKCGCPGYAPDYCAADMKCTSPMKDPDHCGNCETKCGMQSACSAGACTPDLTTVAEIPDCGSLKLVLSGPTIYTLSTMSGTLSSVPAAGGAPMQIATGLTGATAFAIDATNAYVVAGMSIQRVPLAGGAAAPVVTETAAIHDVAVSGTTLYYATGNGVKSVAANAAAGTGTLVALAASEGEPQGVAVSGAILLYGSASSFNVERCDTALICNDANGADEEIRGTGHIRVGMSQGGLIFGHRSVQTDGTKVYWVNNGLQSAPIMPDAGGAYPGVGVGTPKDGGTITAFAIKGTTAYFAEQSPGATPADPPLVNFEKQGAGEADPTWLARNLAPVSSIVVDDTSVYLAAGCNLVKSPL